MTNKKAFNAATYLKLYWPPIAKSNDVWKENKWLLKQYYKATKVIRKVTNKSDLKNIDISTGPCLAPTIVFSRILDEIQLSDYSLSSRKILKSQKVEYWKDYVKEILKIEHIKPTEELIRERINKLGKLRDENKVIKCNVKNKNIFGKNIKMSKFNLFTMHFVVESTASSKEEYFINLKNILNLMKKGDFFVMTTLINSTFWEDGSTTFKVPPMSLEDILKFLKTNKLKVLNAEQSFVNQPVGVDGGMAVIVSQVA